MQPKTPDKIEVGDHVLIAGCEFEVKAKQKYKHTHDGILEWYQFTLDDQMDDSWRENTGSLQIGRATDQLVDVLEHGESPPQANWNSGLEVYGPKITRSSLRKRFWSSLRRGSGFLLRDTPRMLIVLLYLHFVLASPDTSARH